MKIVPYQLKASKRVADKVIFVEMIINTPEWKRTSVEVDNVLSIRVSMT